MTAAVLAVTFEFLKNQDFWINVGVLATTYGVFALGVQLNIGTTGIFNFGQAGFMRLVQWFGVSIADLVQEPNRSPVQVVRADERRSVRLADERLSIQMLSADGNHAMMPVINTYDEGGGMADPTTHDGEEFVHVLDGHVELTVGRAEPIVLGPGDSAYYRSDVPHSFRNAGRGMARFLGVTTPPNL